MGSRLVEVVDDHHGERAMLTFERPLADATFAPTSGVERRAPNHVRRACHADPLFDDAFPPLSRPRLRGCALLRRARAATGYLFCTVKGDTAPGKKLSIYTSTDALSFPLLSDTGFGGASGNTWAPEWFVDGATVTLVANIDTLNTDSDFKPYLFTARARDGCHGRRSLPGRKTLAMASRPARTSTDGESTSR